MFNIINLRILKKLDVSYMLVNIHLSDRYNFLTTISALIFQKVATEINHILRLSRLKEYASPENKASIGSIVYRKKLKRSKNSMEDFSLKVDMTLS